MTTNKSFLSLGMVLMLAFTACNDQADDTTDQNGLDVYGTTQCEEGYIAWRFPTTGAAVDSEEYLASAEGSTDELLSIYDQARIKIKSIEYGSYKGQKDYSLDFTKVRFESACEGRASCQLPTTICPSASYTCDVADLKITYTCQGFKDSAGADIIYTSESKSGPTISQIKLSCAAPARERIESQSRVACVPRVCHGRARRNKDMNCVVDATKPEVVVSAEIDYPQPIYAAYDAFSLYENIVPKLESKVLPTYPLQLADLHDVTTRVKFANGVVPEEVKFTAWLEQEIEMVVPKFQVAKGTKYRAYRCSPFGFTVKASDPHTVGDNGEWIFEKKTRVNFSQECSAAGSYDSMLDVISRQIGVAAGTIHSSRDTVWSRPADRFYMHLAYDMQGQSVWHKGLSVKDPLSKLADSEPECSPNPTPFFYNADKRFYDMSAYYQQRTLASAKNPVIFSTEHANRAEMGPVDFKLRSDLVLRPNSTFTAPVKVDLSWYINNFNPTNPFAPDAEDLGMTFVKNLRADVYVLPMGLTDAARKTTVPVKLGSIPLKPPRSESSVFDKHHFVSQTDIHESSELRVSNAVRDVFTKASSASTFSFIADDVAMFDVFYCVNADLKGWKNDPTLFRPLPSDTKPVHGRQLRRRDDAWYLAELGDGRKAQIDALLTHSVSLESDKVPAYAAATSTEPWKIRGCVTSAVPLTIYVDRYATPFEPISEVGVTGQADEKKSGDDDMSGGNDADYAETCADGSTQAVYCNTTSRSNGRSEGQGGGSMFDLITKIQNTAQIEGDLAPRSAVSFEGAMLGLFTLDQNSLVGDWADGKVPGSSQSIKFTMSPPWDDIYNKLKGKKPAPNAEWKKGYERGREGLGMAWVYRILIKLGPVPVFVKFSFSIGGSFALEVKIDFAPQEEDDEYACLGSDETCVELETTPATYAQATSACYAKGGRLAELSSAAEADALVGALAENGVEEAWIGAQLAYKHEGAKCVSEVTGWSWVSKIPTLKTTCENTGNTEYRWLSTGASIASNIGKADTVYPTDAPLYKSKKEGLKTKYPEYAAVFYNSKTDILGVAQLDGKDKTPAEVPKKAYACALDGAGSETYLKWSIGANLGVAVGFGLTGCTPTPDNGFCLGADFSIAKLEIVPQYYQVFRWLYKTGEEDAFGRRGMMGFSIPLELKLFSGEVKAFVQVLWWTVEWVIRDFEGISVLDENLYELELPMKEVY